MARELAEFVGMLQPNNLPINTILPIVFIDNNEEVSTLTSYNTNNGELDITELEEVETIDLSAVIDQATTSMKDISNKQINQDEIIIDDNFQNGFPQLELFNETIDNMSILNCGDSG